LVSKFLLNFPAINQLNVAWSVKRRLARAGCKGFKVTTTEIDPAASPNMFRVIRDGRRLAIAYQWSKERDTHATWKNRMSAALFWAANCRADALDASFALDDGHLPNEAMFFPSTNRDDRYCLPDEYFFADRGFARMRKLVEETPTPWTTRSASLRWRGSPNGPGRLDVTSSALFDPTVLPRLRLVMIAAGLPDVDVKMVALNYRDMHYDSLQPSGAYVPPIAETDWLKDKYALDIDGFSNTWSNLILRMHFGCCVLKVQSQFGYRQWYYGEMRPYEHFVPVKADMSDLGDQLEWVRSHPREAEDIARHGQAFVRSLTFESETRRAAETIEGALGL
jgi:hypothetical protein